MLTVDAARLMPFGGDNVEAAKRICGPDVFWLACALSQSSFRSVKPLTKLTFTLDTPEAAYEN